MLVTTDPGGCTGGLGKPIILPARETVGSGGGITVGGCGAITVGDCGAIIGGGCGGIRAGDCGGGIDIEGGRAVVKGGSCNCAWAWPGCRPAINPPVRGLKNIAVVVGLFCWIRPGWWRGGVNKPSRPGMNIPAGRLGKPSVGGKPKYGEANERCGGVASSCWFGGKICEGPWEVGVCTNMPPFGNNGE